ncbi:MAG: ATP-binding protein, partial [Bacteroidota bacterium]
IKLLARRTDTELRFDVEDDGSGFVSDTPASGMGLRSMRARAKRHGGALAIEAVETGGTTVQLVLPLDRVLQPVDDAVPDSVSTA